MGGIPEGCRECAKLNARGASSTPQRCPRHKANEEARAAYACLDMVRETLETFGLDMSGTPPMMYNHAVRQLASILGRKAGLRTVMGIAGIVAEHEAERKEKPKT